MIRVDIAPDYHVWNHWATGLVQSGNASLTPIWDHGLHGEVYIHLYHITCFWLTVSRERLLDVEIQDWTGLHAISMILQSLLYRMLHHRWLIVRLSGMYD